MITAEENASKESAPNSVAIEESAAFDAAPDKGRIIIRGNIPEGIFKKSPMGERREQSISAQELARNRESAAHRSTIVGISPTQVCIPSFAPRINAENTSFFGFKNNITERRKTEGITREEMNSAMT